MKTIDLAALAVPPAAKPKGDISTAPKKRKAWVRTEEHKVQLRANLAKASAVESARRGVTRWHRITMAMADGEWRTTREVWKLLPRVPLDPLSGILTLMMRYGLVERKPIPNARPRYKRGKCWWNPGKWYWRITPKGREHAREGRLRRLLE